MPNPIVLAQADAPVNTPAEASLDAQIQAQVQDQVQDLVNEIQVPPDRPDFPRGPFNPDSPLEDLIPMVLFLSIAAVFCVKYYLNYRAKQEVQATVRAALERGVPTGELLDRMVDTPPPKGSDLRRGVIWIALGVGLAAFGFLVDADGAAARPMLAIGLVPFLLGAAYLVLWRLRDTQG